MLTRLALEQGAGLEGEWRGNRNAGNPAAIRRVPTDLAERFGRSSLVIRATLARLRLRADVERGNAEPLPPSLLDDVNYNG